MTAIIVLAITQAAIVAALFVLQTRERDTFAQERREWVAERRELNQRIQAPEVAVAQAIDMPDGPAYVAPDDDKAWNDYVRGLDG